MNTILDKLKRCLVDVRKTIKANKDDLNDIPYSPLVADFNNCVKWVDKLEKELNKPASYMVVWTMKQTDNMDLKKEEIFTDHYEVFRSDEYDGEGEALKEAQKKYKELSGMEIEKTKAFNTEMYIASIVKVVESTDY